MKDTLGDMYVLSCYSCMKIKDSSIYMKVFIFILLRKIVFAPTCMSNVLTIIF